MKSKFWTVMLYFAMFDLGLLLWVIFIPIANQTRANPTIWGGECLFPILTVFGTLVVRTIRKERRDGRN